MSRLVVFLAVLAVAFAAPKDEKTKRQVFFTDSVADFVAPSVYSAVAQAPLFAHETPVVTAVAQPSIVAKTVVASAPAVVAPAYVPNTLVAHSSPVVAAGPVYAAKTVYAPAAVSHQARFDVHHTPAVVASVPAYAARSAWDPIYYSKPVYTAYSKPLYSSYAW